MIFKEIKEGWAFHRQPEGSESMWMARHADTPIVGFGNTQDEAAFDLAEKNNTLATHPEVGHA